MTRQQATEPATPATPSTWRAGAAGAEELDRLVARQLGLERIPGGLATLGDTRGDGLAQERPSFQARLDDYWIGRCCVTAREYFAFVSASGSDFDELWCDCMDPCFVLRTTAGYRLRAGAAAYPMVQVSFVGAVAYCNWLSTHWGLEPVYDLDTLEADLTRSGLRLPTEAEWEHACRGPSNGEDIGAPPPRELVCGPDHTGPTARLRAGDRRIGGFAPHLPSPLPVGTLPANGYGLHELLGNVNEWCHDRYAPYTSDAKERPAGPARGSFRVIRGGAFITPRDLLRASYRHGIHSEAKCMVDGFRLARST